MHAPSPAQPVGRACQHDENCPWQWPRQVAILYEDTIIYANLACFVLKIVLTVPLA